MSEPAVLSARLIGEIFVERGLVSHEQLEEALAVQQSTGEMIGEVLVSSFGVSRIELASVLAEQWSAMERGADDVRPVKLPVPPVRLVEDEDAIDPQSKRPLGQIFVERGMATEEQLEEALKIQSESGERLGEILVRMGVIQRLDLAGALAEQWAGLQKLRPPDPKPVEAWQDLAVRPAGPDGPTNGSTDLPALQEAVTSIQKQLAALAARPDPDLTTLRAETRAVEERLAGMEGRVDGLATAEDVAQLAAAVEHLSARASAAEAQDLASVLAELTDRVAALAADTALADRVAGIEEQVVESGVLREELTRLQADVAQAVRVGDLDDLRRRLDETAPGSLGERVDELAAGLARLAQRADDDAVPTHDPQLDARISDAQDALSRLSEQLGSLADRVDRMEGLGGDDRNLLQTLEGRVATAVERAELDALAEGLQDRLARTDEALRDLVAVQSQLSERPTRDELTASVAEIAARLDELGSSGHSGPTAPLAASVAELAARIDALEPAAHSAADRADLAALVAGLRDDLDELRRAASSDWDEARVTTLGDAVEELRSRLEESVGRAELAVLAEDLGGRLEEVRSLAQSLSVEGEIAALRGVVDEVRLRADRSVDRDDLDGLQQRLTNSVDALGDRIETISGIVRESAGRLAARDDLAQQLSARIDEINMLAAGSATDDRVVPLVAAVEELRSRLDESAGRLEMQALVAELWAGIEALRAQVEWGVGDDRVGSLVASVDELRANVAEALGRLDGTLGFAEIEALELRLGARIDEIRGLDVASGGDDERITALAHAVAELQARAGESVGRPEVAALAGDLDARVDELRRLVESLNVEERVAPVEGAVSELRGWLESLQGRLDGAANRSEVSGLAGQLDEVRIRLDETVGRPEVVALAGDLGARVDEVRALVASSSAEERVAPVDGAVAELWSALGELRSRVDGAVGRGELDALVAQIGALRESVETVALGDRVAPLEGAVAELRGWLGSVQGRLDGVAERAEVEGLATQLGHRLDELAAVADLRLAELAAHEDELARGAHAVAERVDVLTRDLESTAGALRGELEERLAGLASRKRLDRVEGELVAKVADLAQRVEGTPPPEALEALGIDVHERIAALDAIVRDAAAHAASAPEVASRIVHEHLGEMVGRQELAALSGDLDARVAAAAASSADLSAQLAAGLDAIAIELREGLALLHGRVDELAAGLGHASGRLAAVEQTAASGATVDEIAARLAAVQAKVELETSVADERARATERAIRKGLASLGERLVAGEQAYLEAGVALRRSLERLGAAVVEADARIVGEPLDAPGVGYVAFVPTADGYRLRPMDGVAPAVGEVVELGYDEPAMRVGRVTVSPLPLDRRPCVYLEVL